jgi:dienelactone hydrolase
MRTADDRTRIFALLAAIVLSIGVLVRPIEAHVRAASLLTRFSAGGDNKSARVREDAFTFEGARGKVRTRIYTPIDVRDAPGIVMVHGVHRLGIDEPRLIRFARTIAESGVTVMTPDIDELRDYHVDPRSIDTIGESAHAFREKLSQPKIGIMGMSFAGGLAILAAADPRYAPDIGFVVSVGGHDDLARVSRFFATNRVETFDGKKSDFKAHEYGPLVLVYSRIDDFFAPQDTTVAKDALRLWLWEDRDAARVRAKDLSRVAKEKMDALFDGHIDRVAPEILAEIERRGDVMSKVSPHGHLENLTVPIFLLHGSGDSVIPATEAMWLAHDVPKNRLFDVLVSAAIQHVELEGKPSFWDQLALVHFMAEVLEQADADR